MRPLTQQGLRRIRTVLLDEVQAFAPDWTDRNEQDPGVTPSGVLLVQLIFSESLAVPVPAVPPESEQQFSRVEETFAIVLAQAIHPDAVPLARLTVSRGRWRVDRGFKRPRARK